MIFLDNLDAGHFFKSRLREGYSASLTWEPGR